MNSTNCTFEPAAPLGASARPPASPAGIRRMFDDIAPVYDRCNGLLSLGTAGRLRRRMARLARLPRGGRLLDLCTGTADGALAARALRADAQVIGIDFSAMMLDRARAKTAGRGVHLVAGDCLALPVRSGSIDAVTVAWGLRNTASPGSALAEAARVLRPGGRLVVLEFSRPRSKIMRKGLDIAFRLLARAAGLLAGSGGRAYAYLPRSIAAFPAAAELSTLLEERGFAVESVRADLLGYLCTHVAVKKVV